MNLSHSHGYRWEPLGVLHSTLTSLNLASSHDPGSKQEEGVRHLLPLTGLKVPFFLNSMFLHSISLLGAEHQQAPSLKPDKPVEYHVE